MKRLLIGFIVLAALSSCGGWGGYVHKSDRFKFKFVFPVNWEVWDRSDDNRDYLVANLPDVKESEITLLTTPVSPDLSPHEIYPLFLDGGKDGAFLQDFEVVEQGTIRAKNIEGRMILIKFTKDRAPIRGLRAMFLGNRFTLEIHTTMPEDQFVVHEADFRKMISLMEF